ncbi:TIGR03435 family protein [Acidobacteria bacterium AB60]|nr:TIGR03435 family protein [Acidobacteria bacterium AB60]
MGAMTASPSGTASAPPGQKSFCTSTMRRRSRDVGRMGSAYCCYGSILAMRFRALTGGLILAAMVCPALRGQSGTKEASAFEVASVRPAALAHEGGEGSSRSQIEVSLDGVTMHNVDLSEMIEWAYGLGSYELAKTTVLENQRWDVRARAGDRVTESGLRRMTQDLLAMRFKLQTRREKRQASVYELVVAKGGAKLPKDKSATLPPGYARESLPHVANGSFVFSNVSMGEFAQQLTELRGIDRPVVDRTGIAGVYDITLKGAASAMLDPQGASILTLVEEQLGLKLAAAKGPIEVMVVDHAEAPSPD